ncbi:MAG: hypothetical protein ACE5I7_06640 [Candidatus Binatia bacterium]
MTLEKESESVRRVASAGPCGAGVRAAVRWRATASSSYTASVRVKVDAYAGHTANERPLRFVLGDRTLAVRDILDRWYSETERYFRISADDGNLYVLKYRDRDDCWELVSFTHQDSRGTDPRTAVDKTLH